MCGLVGAIGKFNSDDLGMVQDLAYVIGLRGQDGAGVLQGRSDQWHTEFRIKKTGWNINTLMKMHRYGKDGDRFLLNSQVDNFFAVHARHATKGEIDEKNSHPFETERYVGEHNGTLTDQKYQHATKTDSELMFQDMDERGVGNVLKDLNPTSAFAIVMFDKRTGEFIFARNSQRTLFFAYNRARPVLYWASEKEMLTLCAARNHVNLGEIATITKDHVYTVSPSSVRANSWPRWFMYDLFQSGPSVTVTPTVPSVPVTQNKGKRGKKSRNQITIPPKAGVVFTEGGVQKVTQEDIELARARSANPMEQLRTEVPAAADQSELIKLAKAARAAILPQAAVNAIEASNTSFAEEFRKRHNAPEKWEDFVEGLVNDENNNQFDSVGGAHAFEPQVETGVVKGENDLRFKPRRLPEHQCTFCREKLSPLAHWNARVMKSSDGQEIIACKECDDLSIEMQKEQATVH